MYHPEKRRIIISHEFIFDETKVDYLFSKESLSSSPPIPKLSKASNAISSIETITKPPEASHETTNFILGRYYHASGERRVVIWRAVSDEKPIIVKNISYFRNYY